MKRLVPLALAFPLLLSAAAAISLARTSVTHPNSYPSPPRNLTTSPVRVARPSVADPRSRTSHLLLADPRWHPSEPHNLTTSQPEVSPQSKLAHLEQTVRRLRQLNQLRAVKVVFLPDKQFNQLFSARAHKDTPEADIQVSQKELDLLGLLKPSQDLHKILFSSLSAQIGGFYDDHVKELFVRNHANQVLGLRRDLIAHEYTHALQDQHYNLLKLTPDLKGVKYRNSDTWLAHKSLIEGDAVNTQDLFIFNTYTRSELAAFVHEQATLPKTPTLPRAIQREFDFQYIDGLKFVQTLYSRGRMKAIDHGFAKPPGSTYEIMHPSAYLHNWKPMSVALHGVKSFEHWKRLDDDVFGAFGYKLLLWQSLPQARAGKIADGWRGDRYVLLENAHQDAMLFKSVWTTSRTAGQAAAAIRADVRSQYGLRPLRNGVVTLPQALVYIHPNGPQLTIVYATSPALAKKVGTALTY